MRVSRRERQKLQTAKLRVILERLIIWGQKDEGVREIDRLPELDVILKELGHFISVGRQTGAGDPAYNKDGGSVYNTIATQIQVYGIHLAITQNLATQWQWELIKRAISEAGFHTPRSGQCDWWMSLDPRWRIYNGTKKERDVLRPLIAEYCRIHSQSCRDVAIQFGISDVSARNFLGGLRARGVLRYDSRRREYGGGKLRLSLEAHGFVPEWYRDFLRAVAEEFPRPGVEPDQISEEVAARYTSNVPLLVNRLTTLFANGPESKK